MSKFTELDKLYDRLTKACKDQIEAQFEIEEWKTNYLLERGWQKVQHHGLKFELPGHCPPQTLPRAWALQRHLDKKAKKDG